MKTIVKAIAATFVLMSANKSFAQANATANATATATIIAPIKITKDVNMNFGNVAVHATNNGTVALGTNNSRTANGGVTLPGSAGTVAAASFTVEGDASRAFTIALPSSTTLSDGASHNMTVNTFVSSLGAVGTLSSGGSATLKVGATLNVNGGQTAGVYTGNFDVTVDYQ